MHLHSLAAAEKESGLNDNNEPKLLGCNALEVINKIFLLEFR